MVDVEVQGAEAPLRRGAAEPGPRQPRSLSRCRSARLRSRPLVHPPPLFFFMCVFFLHP